MTAAQRQAVRNAIDAKARERRQTDIHTYGLTVCTECDCDPDTQTRGCKTCLNRVWAVRRRERAACTT